LNPTDQDAAVPLTSEAQIAPLYGRGRGENLSIVLQKCGIARHRHVVPLSER
jgi:hypothetical protein